MIPSCLKEEIIMSSQRKAEAVASENIVTTETSSLSDLWKKEDWLAVLVRFISAEYTLNRYLEWAFFAILIGILVSNTVGVPTWLKPAIQTEFYIKVGLVIMGFSVLFSNIVNFGLYGLGIAWIVTPIVILFMWWFGTRVLKIDNKPFVITLATATSVCGTSAAIAVGAASKEK